MSVFYCGVVTEGATLNAASAEISTGFFTLSPVCVCVCVAVIHVEALDCLKFAKNLREVLKSCFLFLLFS